MIERLKTILHRIGNNEVFAGYVFLLPNFIGFAVFYVLPFVMLFGLTLFQWDLFSEPFFLGLENYTRLFEDDLFFQVLGNTLYYTFGAVPPAIALAFFLALLMNRQMRGRIFFRVVYFLPFVSLMAGVAVVWRWLYHQTGLVNYLLSFVGISGPNWLYDTTWAMPAIIIMSNWKGIGYPILIFLAALQGIPEELHDAARVDGATSFQQVWYVTIPLCTPAIFFAFVTSFIGALQSFDQFFIMTQGGPAYHTTPIVYYIYQSAFDFFEMGYASTLGTVLFFLIMLVTVTQWLLARYWVFGEEQK